MQSTKRFVLPLLALLAVWSSVACAQAPIYSYQVINRYPHDSTAFTQGLILLDGALYESTGLNGSSTLREVDLHTGAVLRRVEVPSQYFAEGMTIFQGKIFQLTWQSHTGFIYDRDTFNLLGQFFYTGEGWGLTHDDRHLIMSDGTNQIRFLDPITFQVVRSIGVYDDQGRPLTRINELEYINGEIYANIWLTNRIVRIDPLTGSIIAWIDLTGLLPAGTSADVLNGIAHDEASGHLLVTGKWWPWLFEINLRHTSEPAMPELTTPAPGSTLTATTVQLQWTEGTGVTGYWIYVGRTPGSADFVNQDVGTALTATAGGLPADGSTLYVRLWSLINGAWLFKDYSYTAVTATVTGLLGELTTPAPGSTLTATTVQLQWTEGTGVTGYWIYVGRTVGSADFVDQNVGTALTAIVSGLPADGSTLSVRLWSLTHAGWQFNDYTYRAPA